MLDRLKDFKIREMYRILLLGQNVLRQIFVEEDSTIKASGLVLVLIDALKAVKAVYNDGYMDGLKTIIVYWIIRSAGMP